MRRAGLGLLAVSVMASLALALSGCSFVHPGESVPGHSSTSEPLPEPTTASCLSSEPAVNAVRVGALEVQVLGEGRAAVVISNESEQDLCSWKDVADSLLAQGYTVALYDYVGAADDNAVAVARWMRAHGTSKLALFGGSMGAMASVIAAARLKPAPDALVALSAEQYLEGTDVGMSAAKLRCPTLFVTADNDPYGSDAADAGFQKLAPKGVSTLTVVPGTDHGIQLLAHADVMEQVKAFLKTELG
jgi:pimeloyl-ACP methyl ester carboxylesterase